MVSHANQNKQGILSHSQYLNVLTVLVLASVVLILFLFFLTEIVQVPMVLSVVDIRTVRKFNLPELTEVCQNPLFDLAGILCGQLGSPFWKFFLATLIGKAVIKTHIQTLFIMSVCNNQLLDRIENKLIWVLSIFLRLAAVPPNLINKLPNYRDSYISASPPVTTDMKVKRWDISFASIWKTVVWLMFLNFCVKIVTATSQSYLKEQQEKELKILSSNASS